jgi:hypothetical protein
VPGLVHHAHADEIDGCQVLVMEFVDGLDLGRVVRQGGPPAVADACEAVRQAAVALDYVQAHGMVHRDVKPSNLMLCPGGTVKLLDLGLALLCEGRDVESDASVGVLRLGTPDYMAPEQADDAHRVDIRADLYSLGCTLFHLLAGRPPFSGQDHDTATKKLRAHAEAPVPSLPALRPETPAALAAVVERLLGKDPADRFALPRDVVAALRPFAAGSDLPALLARTRGRQAGAAGQFPTPSVGPALASPSDRPTRVAGRRLLRARFLVPAAVALLAVLGAGVFFLSRRTAQPEPPPQEATRPAVPPAEPPPAPPAEPPPAAIQWPADYPPVLRDRPWQQPVSLLEAGPDRSDVLPDLSGARAPQFALLPGKVFQPAWCRRLFGAGQYQPCDIELQLWSRPDRRPRQATVLALDDDLRRRWFELAVELPQYINDQFRNPRGVFFGWQEAGPGQARAYFVQLDLRPAPDDGRPHGRLLVGPAVLELRPPDPDRALIAPLPAFQGTPPRAVPLTTPGHNYLVRVRAIPGLVRVQVNAERPIEFAPPFDPRGPLGIWAQEGGGRFRTATVTAVHVP